MPPGAVQLITRHGARFHAHKPGQKVGIDLSDPHVHVHLHPGVMLDPGDGSPHVDVHDAFHNNPKSLPPGLLKLVEEAVRLYLEQQKIHEQAGSPLALPGARKPPAPVPALGGPNIGAGPMAGGPPPPMPMPGGPMAGGPGGPPPPMGGPGGPPLMMPGALPGLRKAA